MTYRTKDFSQQNNPSNIARVYFFLYFCTMVNKNKNVLVAGRQYELFLTMDNAKHIARQFYNKEDNARHFDFDDIETMITKGTPKNFGKNRWQIKYKIDGIFAAAVVYLIGKRCVIKSGRVCNIDELTWNN